MIKESARGRVLKKIALFLLENQTPPPYFFCHYTYEDR